MWYFEAKGNNMERYTELLYWLDFSQYIHYNEEDDTYYYDEELPERARKSFEAWKKQAEDWGDSMTLKEAYNQRMNQIVNFESFGETEEFTEEEKKKNDETLMRLIEESKRLQKERLKNKQ